MDSFASFVGGTLASAAQSFGSEKLIEKATEVFDDKLIYPRIVYEINDNIKKKYCCFTFYNSLDAYLTDCAVVNNYLVAIKENTIVSKPQFQTYHVGVFKEKYPQYSIIDYNLVEECFGYIYDEVKKRVLGLNVHTSEGKLERIIEIEGVQTREGIASVSGKQDKMMGMLMNIASQLPLLSPTSIQPSICTTKDADQTSDAINVFFERIESIGTPENPTSNDEESIRKYMELASDALVSLVGEDPQQIKKVICSIMCHIAIHYSNLGNIDAAFEHLSKISPEIAENSILYHFVNAAVIVNNCIVEKYEEANISINKVLELDPNHRRAFIVVKYLCALQKNESLETILTSLDTCFASALTEDKENSILADYYLHRGLICKEFGEYDMAEKDFLIAREKGYDPLISDYNIGVLIYSRATKHLPKSERVFCAEVDVASVCKIMSLFGEWLFTDKGQNMPTFIKTRMVDVYVSCCGILGIKHNLYPIKDYIHLPGLEYETKRILILGGDGIFDDSLIELLTPEDIFYVKIARCINDNYEDIQRIICAMDDDSIKSLPIPTVCLVLQASVVNGDLETYRKFRVLVEDTRTFGLIECVDAYALEKEGNITKAKEILDRFSKSSLDYKLLHNILNFYARNNFDEDAENLFLRILDLSLDNQLYIDEKLEFYKLAIIYFIERKSMNAQRFVENLDIDCPDAWKLKAGYFDAINDAQGLLETLDWLCENAYEDRFAFNRIICLEKLMRYDEALTHAANFLDVIHPNNIKDRTNLMWLISNIHLYLGNDTESYEWAKQAHELTKDIPSDRSHQAYLARGMRTGHIDDSLAEILEYNDTHPKISSKWMTKFSISEEAPSEELSKAIEGITGWSHDDYQKKETDFLLCYKRYRGFPNSIVLKHYGNDFFRFFEFAKKNKLYISRGTKNTGENQCQCIDGHIIIDAVTLVVLQYYGCFDVIQEIENVHICYSTLERLLENYQTTSNAGYVAKIIEWLRTATNITWEPDGYVFESSLSDLIPNEYIVCCRIAAQNQIPLLSIEPSVQILSLAEEERSFIDIKTICPVSLGFDIFNDEPERLSNYLYKLLENCTFISFTADTIYQQIRANNFSIDDEALSRFFICKASYDMISFENVYISTISMLTQDHYCKAVEFASLVLDNALVIWRRGSHDRDMAKRFENNDSKIKSRAVNQYLILLVSHVIEIFSKDMPEILQDKCDAIKEHITEEFGRDYLDSIMNSMCSEE